MDGSYISGYSFGSLFQRGRESIWNIRDEVTEGRRSIRAGGREGCLRVESVSY